MKRVCVILVLILLILYLPVVVSADVQVGVSVSASGIVVEAPQGFVIVYVDDLRVQGFWNIPPLADIVELRYKFGSYPTDRNDGTLVYTGNATSAMLDMDLTGSGVPYFRIWSRRSGSGLWENIGSLAKGDFMTQSWMLMVLLLWAMAVVFLPIIVRVFFGNPITKVLYALTAAVSVFALLVFINDTANNGFTFSFEPNWAKLWIISIITFVFNIIVVAMGTTIDKSGKTTTGFAYTKKDIRSETDKAYYGYKEELHKRLNPSTSGNVLKLPKRR